MEKEKIDISAPKLRGKYIEVNKNGTEFALPPCDYLVLKIENSDEDLSLLACSSTGCDNKVSVSEDGNPTYAWYNLTNNGDKYAGVTIERRWIYEGAWRKDTVRHRLYPGEHKEVFSFPRNQNPMCCVIACSFEG